MKEQITVDKEEYITICQNNRKLRDFIIQEQVNIDSEIEFLESIKKSKKRLKSLSELYRKSRRIEELLK